MLHPYLPITATSLPTAATHLELCSQGGIWRQVRLYFQVNGSLAM